MMGNVGQDDGLFFGGSKMRPAFPFFIPAECSAFGVQMYAKCFVLRYIRFVLSVNCISFTIAMLAFKNA